MKSLAGTRVVVTGGAGLIGSHLVDSLQAAGTKEIRVFDNFSRGRLENLAAARARGKLSIIEGDIRDRAALAEALRGVAMERPRSLTKGCSSRSSICTACRTWRCVPSMFMDRECPKS